MIKALSVVAGAACMWWWLSATPPSPTPAPAEDATRLVPLSGAPLADAMAAGECMAFVEEMAAFPHWSLGVVDAASGCLGTAILGTYQIEADGTVAWTDDGVTRTVQLDPVELATVRTLSRLPCERIGEVGYGERFLAITVGPAAIDAGGTVSTRSVMGQTLVELLERAIERTAESRLWSMDHPRLHLVAKGAGLHSGDESKYVVDVDGKHLTVRHRGRVVHQVDLTARQVVDMIDGAMFELAGLLPGTYDRDRVAHGSITIDGKVVPVAVSWDESGGLLEPLGRAVADVVY